MKDMKILVVDDSESNRTMMETLLQLHGHLVITAENGVAGIQMMEKYPSIDIVMSDVDMPGADGFEVLAAAREKIPNARLWLMSGEMTPQRAYRATHNFGAEEAFLKPDFVKICRARGIIPARKVA